MTNGQRFAAIATAIGASALCVAASAVAQTRTVRDTATAYGARLDAKGEPADLNQNRYNNRINSRLDTRVKLRIERYRLDSVNDPTATFAAKITDNSRAGVETTMPRSLQTGEPQVSQDLPQRSPFPSGTQPYDNAERP